MWPRTDQRSARASRNCRVPAHDRTADTRRSFPGVNESTGGHGDEGIRMAIALMRALHAEMLKLKGTTALKIVVLFPLIVALLEFFAVSQAPFSSVNRDGIQYEWAALTLGILRPWGLLMMPLFIALECALVAGLDHSGNQWKS